MASGRGNRSAFALVVLQDLKTGKPNKNPNLIFETIENQVKLKVGSTTDCTWIAQGICEIKSLRSLMPSRKNCSAPMFLLLHFGDKGVFVPVEPAETMGQKDLATQRHRQKLPRYQGLLLTV